MSRCNCPEGARDLQRQDLPEGCWKLKPLALARGPSICPFPQFFMHDFFKHICCISMPASAQLLSHRSCLFVDALRYLLSCCPISPVSSMTHCETDSVDASTMIRTGSLQKVFSHCSSLSGSISRPPAFQYSVALFYTYTRAICFPRLKHGRSQD